MAADNHPPHLRPVPDPGQGSAAPNLDDEQGTPGLTPPMNQGHSSGFVTDVLVELGYTTRERADWATEVARTAGRPPETLLLEERAITPEQLSRATAERYGLQHIDLSVYHVDMAAANLLPVTSARRYLAVPVGYVRPKTLLVAMADPTNVLAVDDIQMGTGLDCEVAVAAAEDVESLIGRLSTLQTAVTEAVTTEDDAPEPDPEISDLQASAEDAPVVKLVYSVLGQAVTEGASDIHFEPEQDEMRIRFRVDGVLYEAARVPKRMVQAVVSRIKIMSDLDIAEKRLPQDGRVGVTINGHRVDLRVTTLPTQLGEGATVRILDMENALHTLDELGMDGEARTRFSAAFHSAYGAVLVTGPTGSGKSTTLYSALNEINQIEKKIITIEDPVEYRMPGINQINVNRKAGLDFATGLRSILRADPDVVMVGEIRDAETARIAIEAALTGHLMLTTLHTNDAPGAIARLSKMGIESFLTASAVDCVVAQRLARRLCPNCKARIALRPEVLAEAGYRIGTELEAYESTGCGRCNNTGYKGRVGIYSVMMMSERIKEMTVEHASEADISEAAREEGMLTLREDGLEKIKSGQTSLEEVVRVTT